MRIRLAALVTLATTPYLRDYSREDYPVLNGVPTTNVQLEVPKLAYFSGAFLKGLLLASIPLALYEHFNEVSSSLNLLSDFKPNARYNGPAVDP